MEHPTHLASEIAKFRVVMQLAEVRVVLFIHQFTK